MPKASWSRAAAWPVLGDGGPITVPANAQIDIGSDGTLTGKVGNGRAQVLGRLKLVTPETPLVRSDDGLFRSAGGDLEADPLAAGAAGRARRQ